MDYFLISKWEQLYVIFSKELFLEVSQLVFPLSKSI